MSDPSINERVEGSIGARGPEYQRLVEQRREHERVRKREARKRQTAEEREHERERKRQARLQQTPEQREREKEREARRDRAKLKPFLAIDGEGGGTDELGRQNYFLMVASGQTAGEEYMLHRQGKPLSTHDCLEFILSLPADRKLVGYGEGYDATQMLRGIKPSTLRQILNPRQGKNGPCYTYWGDCAIVYQQGQYLRVARVDRSGPKPAIVKGSCRTVNETLGFFQCSFVKAITDWKIGTDEERIVIAENKTRRDGFSQLTDEIIKYCKLECRYLAMLMTDFRDVCSEAGISPQQWRGAGWLASALLKKHGVPKRPLTTREAAALAERKPSKNPRPSEPRRPQRDPKLEIAASAAFCGNRAEVSALGFIPGPIYKYDKRSAHPAAMLHLPCPLHTQWEHRPRASRLPDDGIFLAKVSFSHPEGPWCGLSFRQRGGLFWPRQGTTWSWSPEIGAARRYLHVEMILRDLWVAHRECDCRPFEWVKAVYEERRRLGSDTRGYPLKIALASLYGKTAQRCGRGPYHDVVSAGLITSMTRASLLEPLGQKPSSVLMLATDAAFSRERLSLDVGEGLGQWEEKVWPDLFIAQSGVYWPPSDLALSVKSRGAPRSVIGPAAPRFHQAFTEWLDVLQRPGAMECVLRERLIPSVPVTVRVFNGCRLAMARGKPWLAGRCWRAGRRFPSPHRPWARRRCRSRSRCARPSPDAGPLRRKETEVGPPSRGWLESDERGASAGSRGRRCGPPSLKDPRS
jgi:DNA polymerase type B, organellar and viral